MRLRKDQAVISMAFSCLLEAYLSAVPHAVLCNKSDEVRISIAINLKGFPQTTAVAPDGGGAVPS